MGVKYYTSLRTELLVDQLAEQLRIEFQQKDPMVPSVVVMPNLNLRQYLKIELARRMGIAANIQFYFLEEAFGKILHEFLSGENDEEAFPVWANTRSLLFSVAANLQRMEPELPGVELLSQAQEISRLLRDYEYHRPEILRCWEEGRLCSGKFADSVQEKKQRDIYLDLKKTGLTLFDFKEQYFQFLPKLASAFSGPLHVFGLSFFSRFHVDFLLDFSRHVDVRIYQLSLTSPLMGEHSELVARFASPVLRNFMLWQHEAKKRKTKIEFQHADLNELFSTGEFERIQRQIAGVESGKKIENGEKFFAVFGVAGRLREAEAVYDIVAQEMIGDDSLLLTDISVLAPDAAEIQPTVSSAFLSADLPLPFSLSDSSARRVSRYAEAVLLLLQLASSSRRFSEVVHLLRNPAFSTGADYDITMVERMIELMQDAAAYRLCESETQKYACWRTALRRLRLGAVMAPEDGVAELFSGDLPLSEEELRSEHFEFLFFLERELFVRLDTLAASENPLVALRELVSHVLTIPADSPAEESVALGFFTLLEDLEEHMDRHQWKANLDFLRVLVEQTFSGIPVRRGQFLSGGISVSSLLPMRPVPFPMVFLSGLNEGDFPVSQEKSRYDLREALEWKEIEKLSDVSSTEAARLLFIEAVFSARKKVFFLYHDRNVRDLSAEYPSPILQEFLDYLKNEFSLEVPVVHLPLHGLSSRYGFEEFPLRRSESEAMLRSRVQRTDYAFDELFETKLRQESTHFSSIDVAKFVYSPFTFALEREFGIYDEKLQTFEENEPFYSNNRFQRQLWNDFFLEQLSEKFVHVNDTQAVLESLKARYQVAVHSGRAPAGAFGEVDWRRLEKNWVESLLKLQDAVNSLVKEGYEFHEEVRGEGKIKEWGVDYVVPAHFVSQDRGVVLFSGKESRWRILEANIAFLFSQVLSEKKFTDLNLHFTEDGKKWKIIFPAGEKSTKFLETLLKSMASRERPLFFWETFLDFFKSSGQREKYLANRNLYLAEFEQKLEEDLVDEHRHYLPQFLRIYPGRVMDNVFSFTEEIALPLLEMQEAVKGKKREK